MYIIEEQLRGTREHCESPQHTDYCTGLTKDQRKRKKKKRKRLTISVITIFFCLEKKKSLGRYIIEEPLCGTRERCESATH